MARVLRRPRRIAAHSPRHRRPRADGTLRPCRPVRARRRTASRSVGLCAAASGESRSAVPRPTTLRRARATRRPNRSQLACGASASTACPSRRRVPGTRLHAAAWSVRRAATPRRGTRKRRAATPTVTSAPTSPSLGAHPDRSPGGTRRRRPAAASRLRAFATWTSSRSFSGALPASIPYN